jgi:hypothetical protein
MNNPSLEEKTKKISKKLGLPLRTVKAVVGEYLDVADVGDFVEPEKAKELEAERDKFRRALFNVLFSMNKTFSSGDPEWARKRTLEDMERELKKAQAQIEERGRAE